MGTPSWYCTVFISLVISGWFLKCHGKFSVSCETLIITVLAEEFGEYCLNSLEDLHQSSASSVAHCLFHRMNYLCWHYDPLWELHLHPQVFDMINLPSQLMSRRTKPSTFAHTGHNISDLLMNFYSCLRYRPENMQITWNHLTCEARLESLCMSKEVSRFTP